MQQQLHWRDVPFAALRVVMVTLALFSSVTNVTAAPAEKTILVMGDSLSAAYGLSAEQGWVALLTKRLAQDGPAGWRVANASVSGETTAGGAARMAGELARQKPAVVVLELGANDGLRGLPLEAARANLSRMIVQSKIAGARVLLLGMRIPPNYGREYSDGFHAMFAELAREHDTAILPFLLDPVVASRDNFQDDNVHPTAAAQPLLRDHVWTALLPLLKGDAVAAITTPPER
jgi:acyl-CoA thioesterase I